MTESAPLLDATTESVDVSRIVASRSRRSTNAREITSRVVTTVAVESPAAMRVVPDISTRWSSRIRTVSPTGGPMRSATVCGACGCGAWASARDATSAAHESSVATQTFRSGPRRSEPVGIIGRGGAQRRRYRRARRLPRRDDPSELAGEERLHVVGARVQRRIAGPYDLLFRGDGDRILHPA